jgi:poly(A) polymerase Pap1
MCKYRHFIVLTASTPIKEQYMDWVRLVESKIRFLVQALEKVQYISMAHINPQSYEETKDMYTFLCYKIFQNRKFLNFCYPTELWNMQEIVLIHPRSH